MKTHHYNEGLKMKNPRLSEITTIPIRQLHSQFDNTENATTKSTTVDEWLDIFPQAAIFTGFDDILFDYVITIVHRNHENISTKSITKFGVSTYENMQLTHRSRFWPSCENLDLKYQQSRVRRSLAISNLKNSNKLLNHHGNLPELPNFDETHAGCLASNMNLLSGKSPIEFGEKMLQLGLLQDHSLNSYAMDVIYNTTSEENNQLVFLLGEQLDHLFDPLLEYSPETMNFVYTPQPTKVPQSKLITSIVNELVTVQTNYTTKLVDLLQNLITPLRANMLNSPDGITRVNHVFPPTIDEITRINCILNESLLKAKSVNYLEVLRVVANILPYFYKPYVRHEANLKGFYSRLCKFGATTKYSVREIDSIVTGSLLELPRLKLILKRLYDAIESEKLKLKNFENLDEDETMVDNYYTAAMEVIDAFGGQDEHVDLKQRIFTPTGKILTELATNWPAELHYGWLSRKVVGIFKLQHTLVVIFNDYLLFINIIDNNGYLQESHLKKISVSDALMHSLMNEKPLPNLSCFPAMEVSAWCNINEVLATSFVGPENADFIRFLCTSSSGFHSMSGIPHFSKTFHCENATPNTIIDLITKARLLHKFSPFHLFKADDRYLNIYYTAHEDKVYESEISQSPFVLFLNMKLDVPRYFETRPDLQLILQASFVGEDKIQITGYNKPSQEQINEFVRANEFSDFLKHKVFNCFNTIFSTYNKITRCLIKANADQLKFVVDDDVPSRSEATTLDEVKFTPKHDKYPSEPITIVNTPLDNKVSPPIRRRRSICDILKKGTPDTTLKRDISNTFIPRGDKIEYTNTLNPIPTLRRVAQDTTVMHYEIESPDDRTTITTSAPSVDVSPNFQFPVVNDPVIPKSASTIKRIATIDSNRIHLEKRSGNTSNYKLLPIGKNKFDSSPNWESISISRESSIRTNEQPPKKFDEEVANRVVDVSNLFKSKKIERYPSKKPDDSNPKTIRTTKPTIRAFSKKVFAPPPQITRDDSAVSMTVSEMTNEFSHFIDTEFGNAAPPPAPCNTSAITLTSSSDDEEFFSPNEEPNHIRVPSQSESSEATITSTRHKQPLVNDDSVTRLCAYLEKSVDFGVFEI
ncbi:bud site selection protein, putative [Candida dubliniensis CD36]|uniref:Bud site selection protein, putative n=1 Tax=Candida dubliniensis (strain CD36 / ATCC MYA-646 / CBS 7987 / NCPF 3949 / NRRL Y-17841) TaxID=573826 RepID=B9WJH2_CANDC|nr:bud site selection protein, putative [Candida dubliniensis CD36]CAX40614.1 bud site selection protein, putative [Candida dubliniensis CD36]